jgi:uncharacterized protein (TIGR03437 family)
LGVVISGLPEVVLAQSSGPPPSPVISSLNPSQVAAGTTTFTMEVNGANFLQNAVVMWNRTPFSPGQQLSTLWVNPTLLRATVPSSLVQTAGSLQVVVQQNPPGAVVITQTSNSVTFTITAGLTISTACPLPNAIVNQPYSLQLQAAGGFAPYTWFLEGSLPTGISMTTSGLVSGTAPAASQTSFVISVRDARERTVRRSCSLRVVTAPVGGHSIFSLIPNTVLAGSSAVTVIINGTGFRDGARAIWRPGPNEVLLPTTFDTVVRLSAVIDATLIRTPGEFPIVVRQPSSLTAPPTDSNAELFTVVEPVQITTPCPLRDLALGQAYNERLIVTGGFEGYTWDLAGGELPSGITLSPNGTLSGTPTEPGRFGFTLRVTDARSNVVTRECSQLVLGPLSAAPSLLNFVLDGTGAPPPPQEVGITAVGDSVTFTSNANVNWVRMSATSTQTPASVRVLVDTAGLATGVHRGQITFTSDRASNRSVNVDVVLRIDAPAAPQLTVHPSVLRFTAQRGSSGATQQLLRVFNRGSGSINFTAQASTINGGNWLTVAPASGAASAAAPSLLRVSSNPDRLNPGVYRGRITVRAGSTEIVVPVVMMVSTSPDSMTLSQNGLLFTVAAGGPQPPGQRFEVVANGPNGFFWETSVSTLAGGSWLTVDPPSNSSQPGAPLGASVIVDPTGLAPDLYFGEVAVRAGIDNSPRLLSVVLQVLPANATPPPAIEPGGLVFTTSPGGALPPPKPVLIRNLANAPATVSFLISSTPNVFSAGNNAPITIPPGGTRRIEVLANTSSLAAGSYRGTLAVHVSGDPKVRVVDLLAVVGPGISPAAAKDGIARNAAGCVPTRLLPVSTLQTSGFVAPTGLPVPIEVRVLDDCGDPMTTGAVMMSLAPGAIPPLALIHLGDGRWSGTWQVQGSAGAVTATVTADDAVRNLQGTVALNGEVQATQGVPAINEGGVVSAASIALGNPLSPGSIFSAFGVSLADAPNAVTGFPVPTQLGTTRVAIAGRESPMFFAGPTQINGIFPYDLVPNTSYQLSVRRGNRRSNYAEVVIAGTQPAMFTTSQGGQGQGSIVDGANPTVLADTANPVSRGGVVVIYLEGLGAVNRAVVPGQPAPSGPLAEAVASVSVTIGGQPAQVLFAGLTPGFTGLYQVNASVPQNVTPGNAVPVVVTAGEQVSATVTLAVR